MINSQRSKEKFMYLYMYTLINICSLALVYIFIDDNNWLQLLNWVSIIQLFLSIICLKKFGFNYLALPTLFILISYLFHFGQLPLHAFNISTDMPWPVIDLVNKDNYIKSLIFTVETHFFLVLGIILYNLRGNKKKYPISTPNTFENQKFELRRIYIIGIIFFSIGLFPTIYLEYQKLITYMAEGYGNTEIATSGVMSVITSLFYIGIILMLIGKKDNLKFCNRTFLIVILSLALMMISGSRGEKIVRLIVITSIYITVVRKNQVRMSSIFKYGVIGYVGIVFTNFISNYRTQFTGYDNYLDNLIESFSNNQISEAMGEFGGTLISVSYSTMFYPSNHDYLYGMTYLKSFGTLMLNVGGFIDNFRNEIVFIYNFPARYQSNLGGSYIGELYANFGHFGAIIALFIGVFIGAVSYKMNNYILQEKWIKYSIMIVVFSRLLWWVRDYFPNMIREVFWVCGLIVILNLVLKKINTKTLYK